ncbi:DNA repair exonuclease SbcCD nuclease subunit [Hypnocyclicus thermotrophus]|uniref:DNA repair exonuclease SbcCD nuclease subunit n=1 Tax=Hypnocyclicus thermotrophus TaxID=1627895 RepID=A0AA46DX22_9FUSO|nr:exonuclease SbcCD subunit D [Hypnocyclicus thermotrophus]TDT67371.1 DNA repair exonuclease SbcCD nuclease subunit [Hypnocyclicus thermotrophus]
MKILHCSDIHLGKRPVGGIGEYSNKRYEDYFKSFEYIIESACKEKIDIFIIAGDFFDKRVINPEILEKTEKILEKLKENGIKVLIIEGNHDNIIKGNEENSWIVYLEKKGLFKRLTFSVTYIGEEKKFDFDVIKIGDVNFYGLGYPGILVNEAMEELSKRVNPLEKNIVIVHTAISSGDFLPGTIEKEIIDKFQGKVIYIAGGHFHTHITYPKENPIFFIPGASEYWNIKSEINRKKGFIIFDTETKEYKFYDSKTRDIVILNIENIKEEEEVFLKINKEKNNINIIENESLLFINISLEKNIFLNTNEIEKLFEKEKPLKIFINTKYKNSLNNRSINRENISNIYEIEKEVIKNSWDKFRDASEIVVETLNNLKIHQQEKDKERFFEVFDHFVNKIISGDNNENK